MERRRIFTILLTVSLAVPMTASTQSLADVARAEEARRKTVKGTAKVYSNDDLKRGVDPPPAPVTDSSNPSAPSASAKPATPAKPADAAAAAEAPPTDVKDEKYWRNRIASVREALQRNQVFQDALQSQINGLYAEFVNKSDPAQRALVEQKRLKAIAEQDRIKSEILKQTKAIQDIEDEARRAGAPSGWLR
jgi:hypothetical protein